MLRRSLRERAPGEAPRQLAEPVAEHLEQSSFEIDETSEALRQRPPGKPHG